MTGPEQGSSRLNQSAAFLQNICATGSRHAWTLTISKLLLALAAASCLELQQNLDGTKCSAVMAASVVLQETGKQVDRVQVVRHVCYFHWVHSGA